jgi:L-methionine (R)-S-oxide reductase
VRAELVETVRRAAEAAGPIDQAATDLAELIRGRSGRRWVGIYRVTRSEVVNLAWSGPAPPAHPRFPVGQGLTGAAVAGRATVCSNDVAADPRYLTNQETTGSELIVPIMLHGRVVGTLDVEEAHTDAFAPDDERRFEAVARLLSPLYRAAGPPS